MAIDLNIALDQRAEVEKFRCKHRTGLLSLVFTDLVGSTQLKQDLGDLAGVNIINKHHALVRQLLGGFVEAQEINTAGDSFFVVFVRPSDAVKFALLLQAGLRALSGACGRLIQDRVGIHVGEVVIKEMEGSSIPRDLYGIQVDIAARIMSLADGKQILMSRSTFDNARQVLKGQDIPEIKPLAWMNHGAYLLKGVDETLEICEVGEVDFATLKPPPNSEKVRRHIAADGEIVLGWRPAVNQAVPNTQWMLEVKLGEGGFGEVWLAYHQVLKIQRVFKFCFSADRVRSFKREVALFRVLKEKAGVHPNIVGIQDVFFDEPPYYIIMDYDKGQDLNAWCKARGGAAAMSRAVLIDIVAQISDALQAAHKVGVLHRDVKPSNILVHSAEVSTSGRKLVAKLTDFGIGQVLSQDLLAGISRMGFTMSKAGADGSYTGTHLYMAPEVMTGKPATPQSDIYSLGMVLFQLLVGDFNCPLTIDWAGKISDPFLKDIVARCCAGNPADRFETAAQLGEELRNPAGASGTTQGFRWRGTAKMAAGIAIAACVASLSWFMIADFREKSPGKPPKGVNKPESGTAATNEVQTNALTIERWIKTGAGINGICLSRDESKLYAAYWGNESGSPIEEYDVATGTRLRQFQYNNRYCHGDAVLSGDGRFLYTTHYYASHASRIDLSGNSREEMFSVGGAPSAVWAGDIDITPDRKIIAIAVGKDGRATDMNNDQISLVDISVGTCTLVAEIKLPDEPSGHKIGFSKDSRFAYVPTRKQKSLSPRLYEIQLVAPYKIARSVDFPGGELAGVAVCDSLDRVFVSDAINKKIWVVDRKTMSIQPDSISLDGAAPGTICVSHDGSVLYVLLPDIRQLYAIDTFSGKITGKLKGLNRSPYDIEIAQNDTKLFVSHRGDEGGVCIVNACRPKEMSIVFSSDRSGNYQIYRMSSNGSNVLRLTENNASDVAPRWSPDGSRIAFVSDRDGPFRLFIMNHDGSGAAAIPNADSVRGDVNGGSPLDWSPDGQSLVFLGEDCKSLRIINTDGSVLAPPIKGPVGPGYSRFGGVCWRWTTNEILFNVADPSWGYNQAVFGVNLVTKEITQITKKQNAFDHCSSPDVSPNGKTVLVVRQPGKDVPPRSIYRFDIGRADLVPVTNTHMFDAAPRWSSDGTKIVYCSGTSVRKHIWMMNSDGSSRVQLTAGDSDDVSPDMAMVMSVSSR